MAKNRTIYFVANIAGGYEAYASLKEACEAAVGWGMRGTIESRRGIRHVARDFSSEGRYHISDYGESYEDFAERIRDD
jgi:predicted SpoU family rRNA methylase